MAEDQDQEQQEPNIADDQYVENEHMELPGEDERPNEPPIFKSKKSFKFPKKLFIGLLALLAVSGLAFGGWKLFADKEEVQQPESQQSTNQDQTDNVASEGLGSSELDKEYTNDFLRLNFKYPASWTVNDVDDAITIKSPDFKYQQNNGMEATGYFKIYIKKGAAQSDSKYLGQGYAVANSEKIAYSEPATGQRSETFLTDFGLDTPDNFAYFIVQGNFDLKKGDTLGPSYAKEIDAYLISGGFSSSDQTENMATNTVSLDTYKSDEAYKVAIEIVKSLKIK